MTHVAVRVRAQAIGTVENAEEQVLAAVRYWLEVRRKSNDKVFHNETGYYMWDAKKQQVMLDLTIPRAVSLVAGGSSKDGVISVRAALDDDDWPIAQSPFMQSKARTLEFVRTLSVVDDVLEYSQTTYLDIYGRKFDHTDVNRLTRR